MSHFYHIHTLLFWILFGVWLIIGSIFHGLIYENSYNFKGWKRDLWAIVWAPLWPLLIAILPFAALSDLGRYIGGNRR